MAACYRGVFFIPVGASSGVFSYIAIVSGELSRVFPRCISICASSNGILTSAHVQVLPGFESGYMRIRAVLIYAFIVKRYPVDGPQDSDVASNSNLGYFVTWADNY